MRLANGFLPTYEFSETHAMEIKAELTDVMAAVEAFRPEDDRFSGGPLRYVSYQRALCPELRQRTLLLSAWTTSPCWVVRKTNSYTHWLESSGSQILAKRSCKDLKRSRHSASLDQ